MRKLTVFVAVIFASLSLTLALQCGESEAAKSFKAEIYDNMFVSFKTVYASKWTSWADSSAVPIADGSVPDNVKSLFVGKKTCCSADALEDLSSIYQAYLLDIFTTMELGPSAAESKMMSQVFNCSLRFLAQNAKDMQDQGNATVSETKEDPQAQKLQEGFELQRQIIKNKENQALASLSLLSLRLFRSTRSALCIDPDVPIKDIYDGGVLVQEAGVNEIKKTIKESLASLKMAGERQKKRIETNQKMFQILECPQLAAIVNDFVTDPCPGDADCATKIGKMVSSAWAIKLDGLLTQNAGINFFGRRNLAAALKSTATGGIDAQVVNQAEDDLVIKVDNMNLAQITAQTTTFETEQKANPVDYDAYVQANRPANGAFVAFSLFVFGSIFMLFF